MASPFTLSHDKKKSKKSPTMKFSASTTVLFLRLADLAWAGCQDSADGFASLNGGTTGGNGGTVVTVNNQTDLVKYAGSAGKYVIKVSGNINISPKGTEVAVANDKTIIGIGATAQISGGGFKIINKRNVIVRNLRIGECSRYCMQLSNVVRSESF
jgi:pectate lyase